MSEIDLKVTPLTAFLADQSQKLLDVDPFDALGVKLPPPPIPNDLLVPPEGDLKELLRNSDIQSKLNANFSDPKRVSSTGTSSRIHHWVVSRHGRSPDAAATAPDPPIAPNTACVIERDLVVLPIDEDDRCEPLCDPPALTLYEKLAPANRLIRVLVRPPPLKPHEEACIFVDDTPTVVINPNASAPWNFARCVGPVADAAAAAAVPPSMAIHPPSSRPAGACEVLIHQFGPNRATQSYAYTSSCAVAGCPPVCFAGGEAAARAIGAWAPAAFGGASQPIVQGADGNAATADRAVVAPPVASHGRRPYRGTFDLDAADVAVDVATGETVLLTAAVDVE